MITELIVSIFAIAMASTAILPGENVSIPDPVPPFEASSGKRLAPEFKVSTFSSPNGDIQQPGFWLGNKRVGVREESFHHKRDDHDQIVSVIIDGKRIFDFSFWGSIEGLGFGYPFKNLDGQPPKVDFDGKSKTITYSKPYALPSGRTAIFKYVLKSLDEGRVELSWDAGLSDETDKKIAVAPWLYFHEDYREAGVELDGNEVDFLDQSVILGKDYYKGTPVTKGDITRITYAPEKPLKSFSVIFPAKTACDVSEYNTGAGKELKLGMASSRKGSLVIDFGQSAVSASGTPPPLGGIDFWARDAFDVKYPPARNMLRNPGFEQGLRYWTWWWGGSKYEPEKPTPYSISSESLFGGKSLELRAYNALLPLMSFPVPVTKGKTYTLSFYAKTDKLTSVTFAVIGMTKGSKFVWPKSMGGQSYKVDKEWKRNTFTFEADSGGIIINLGAGAGSHVWLDGLQLEEGVQATEFVCPSVEGELLTVDPGNSLESGKPFDAKFVLSGKPSSTGEFELIFRDFYRTEVMRIKKRYKLDEKGSASFALPLEDVLRNGFYTVKARFMPEGTDAYSDFYRLSIVKSLDNLHPTKTLFGNSFATNIPKTDELGKMFKRWGWGYSSYGGDREHTAYAEKYGISTWPTIMSYPPWQPGGRLYHLNDEARLKKFNRICFEQDSISEEDAKFIEDAAYDVVKANPWHKGWTIGCESEGHCKMLRERKFDEYAKVLIAFAKGVKRANPDALLWPDSGTSGFSDFRGLAEINGYLASTKGKIKWDAVAVHPYWTIDGVCGSGDLDVEMAKLVAIMAKYGYGPETPIDIDECFNECAFNIPEWETGGDTYPGSSPTYDQGWTEFRMACHAARTYIIMMKYWPQLRAVNIWRSRPYMDQNLTPLAFCLVPNVLGNLFPNPRFKSDIRPAAGVRGYAFDSGEDCIAAIWCVMDKADEGFEKGPEIGVNFKGLSPEVIDLMGGKRLLSAKKENVTPLRLSPAPLFFKVGKAQGDKLVEALSKAEVSGIGSSLKVSILPVLGGRIEAKLENQTGNVLKGKLLLKDSQIPFEIQGAGMAVKELPFKLNTVPGKIEQWKQTIGVEFSNGKRDNVKWDMGCFYVPHAAKPLPLDPDDKAWDAVPAIPVENWLVKDPAFTTKYGQPGDLEARFQLAWDKDNLYLRVQCKDDNFVPLEQAKWNPRHLYGNDGCVEVYLDTIANARSNQNKGYDQYDYRYDFAPGDGSAKSGSGSVWRLREVFIQLAGGIGMPGKEDAAKNVKCEYRRNGNAYSYVIILPQIYIEPLRLEKGWRAGFGLYVHDKDTGEKSNPASPEKGVSISTKKGVHCDYRPDLWPIMVLD
ncbi:MAG: sugar-binding protein [Victivallales bacterium]|jgi:hypothetical protein